MLARFVLARHGQMTRLGAALAAAVVLSALASSSRAETGETFATSAAQLDPTAGKDVPEATALTPGSNIAPAAARRVIPRGSGRLMGHRLNASAYARRPVPSLILGVRF